MINEQSIIEIRRIPVKDVIERLSQTRFKPNGQARWVSAGPSPFNPSEKTPSFKVSEKANAWYCYSTSQGGGGIDFVMAYYGMGFPEAVEKIANEFGIRLDGSIPALQGHPVESANKKYAEMWHKEALANQGVMEYLTGEREFSMEAIRKFKIGYCSGREKVPGEADLVEAGITGVKKEPWGDRRYWKFAGRITFPIKSKGGKVVGFSARQYDNTWGGKYINTAASDLYDKGDTLYGLSENLMTIRQKRKVILVEGQADVVGLYSVGVSNACASSGTAFTAKQAQHLAGLGASVYVWWDNDAYYKPGFINSLHRLYEQGIIPRVVMSEEEGDDPDSVRIKHNIREYVKRNMYRPSRLIAALYPRMGDSKLEFLESYCKAIGAIPSSLKRGEEIQRLIDAVGKMNIPGFNPREIVQMVPMPDIKDVPRSKTPLGAADTSYRYSPGYQFLQIIAQHPEKAPEMLALIRIEDYCFSHPVLQSLSTYLWRNDPDIYGVRESGCAEEFAAMACEQADYSDDVVRDLANQLRLDYFMEQNASLNRSLQEALKAMNWDRVALIQKAISQTGDAPEPNQST